MDKAANSVDMESIATSKPLSNNAGKKTKSKIMNKSQNSSKITNSRSLAKFQTRKMKYLKIKWNNVFFYKAFVDCFLFKSYF